MLIIAFSTSIAQTWEGEWIKNNKNSLNITNLKGNTFHFQFSCMQGKFSGNAEGIAVFEGNKAVSNFEDSSYCEFKFILNQDKLEVFNDNSNDCYTEGNVTYAGIYKFKPGKKIKKRKII